MSLDLTQTKLDPINAAVQPVLTDLQGNILKSHGRENAIHLFLHFTANPAAVRQWIKQFTQTYVTSAERQLLLCEIFRADGTCGGLFGAFFLSAAGYRVLGFTEEQLPADYSFRMGLKERGIMLNDPPIAAWEPGLQNETHALLLLADDQVPRMAAAVEQIKESLANVANVVHEDQGAVFRNDKGQGIEHFGFVDGTSQPLFLQHDIEEANQHGLDRYDTTAPVSAILTHDPHGRDENSFGSYLVYRKLEQDVYGFRHREQELAEALGIDSELAVAYAVGRFRDGTPVILSERALGEAPANNFDYADDLDGARCPFHAHIRKANPRGAIAYGGDESLEDERQHRIARRGIPYGPLDLYPSPAEKVGLLFMCYQSDIGRQFEYMQGEWSNAGDFVRQQSGVDPLIGQGNKGSNGDRGEQMGNGQNWPTRWGDASNGTRFHFANYITMRGGEYFFAPSISFLTNV